MERNLTQGSVTKSILLFAAPMILGNLFQQFYNVADTLIVGKFIGPNALAAVGSSYALMTFLTSVFIGLCMGSGIFFSMCYGSGQTEQAHASHTCACDATTPTAFVPVTDQFKLGVFVSFVIIGAVALTVNLIVLLLTDPILRLLNTPTEIFAETRTYLRIIFTGILFIFLYNYCACLLRAVGNSSVPLICLIISALTNIVLDLYFVVILRQGVSGAALATVIAQGLSAVAICAYCFFKILDRYRSKVFHAA